MAIPTLILDGKLISNQLRSRILTLFRMGLKMFLSEKFKEFKGISAVLL
jgi:hypothetical protein